MKKVLVVLMLVLFITSCSSPLDKKYSEETIQDDLKELLAEMAQDEIKLIVGGILKSIIVNGESIEGKTYREILNGIEKDLKEEKELTDKILKENQERIDRLSGTVTVVCLEKGFREIGYSSYITFELAIINNVNSKIRAIKGDIIFEDLFGTEIKSLSFVYDTPIDIGGKNIYKASANYNQFKDSDRLIKNKDLENMNVIWKPEKIILDNGDILE